jgi:uncharacterized membrane protein
MLNNFPPLHPAVIHFPVALLLLAGLCGLISLFVKREFWKDITLKALVAGVIFTPIAVVTGFIEEQKMLHGGVDETLTLHKYNGMALLFFFQILLAWFWLRKNIPGKKEYVAWVICLLLGSGLVLLQGYLGGELVFTKGMGVKPVEENMTSGSGGHDGGGKKSEGDDMKGMKGMDKKEGNDGAKQRDEGGKQNEGDDMKDMEGMDTSKSKNNYIIYGDFYQYNTMDKNNMKDKKDMKGMDNMKNKKDMKGMDNMQDNNDMKGMDNMKDKKGMKDMEGMDNMKGKDDMKDMNGMENMKGMNMKSPPDTFKFEDNNPARKAKKKIK